jgi:Cu/Ag efflux protein CusF
MTRMVRVAIRRAVNFLAMAALLNVSMIGLLTAQQRGPKPITFFGQVEGVSPEKKMISVKHGKIDGYMDSGTTLHLVNQESVLERLKVGDDIRATVYANDLTLHNIRIVYRPAVSSERNSK